MIPCRTDDLALPDAISARERWRRWQRPLPGGRLRRPRDPNCPASLYSLPTTRVHGTSAATAATRRDLARYYDEIARMDDVVGRFMSALGERNLDGDTLVVFLSDNGAPFPCEKGTVYDSGVRTPLIFRWPGVVPAGVRHAGLSSVIDLAPTFLALAGIEVRADMQGESIAPGLEDPESLKRTTALSERRDRCPQFARRTADVQRMIVARPGSCG